MPSPNVANKTSAKKTPEKKGQDWGQKLGKRKSQDFTSKIQGWNQGVAGAAQEQDEVVVIEDNEETAKSQGDIVEVIIDGPESEKTNVLVVDEDSGAPTSSGKPTPKVVVATSARTNKAVDLDKRAWVRRKSKPQAEIAVEVKDATSPKKRVVSDGHWRRDRAPPKEENPTPEREITPKPVTIRRSVVSVGLKVPPSVQDFVEEEPAPIRVRPLRQPRSRSREREATPDYEDSGVKVYIKRRKRSKTFNEQKDSSTSQSSFTEGSSIDKTASSTDITTPAHSPTKATPPRPSTAPKEKASRSLEAEDEQRRVSRPKSKTPRPEDQRRTEPTPKSAPKPAHRPAAPITPPVYSNRIDNWLAATSDPFVEERDSRDSSLTPQPLDLSKKKSRKLDERVRDDEDDDRRRSSGRTRRSRPSPEPIDTRRSREDSDASISATPTLRRNGARRATQSPVKDRSAHDTTPPSADTERRPSRGHQLSTIASADTLHTRRPRAPSGHPTVIPEGSVVSRASDGDEPLSHAGGLRRRSTKHSDLMSVLSAQRGNGGLRPSRHSTRSKRVQPSNATIAELMGELTTDELQYQRELRTLVDGVIPVLLTYVLQKTDATGAKRLFSGSSPDGQAVTRPIVEMGVALEKLKAAHKRIPLHDADELVKWAQNTANKYADYLKAWRLGFQDVVVKLAPAEENDSTQASSTADPINKEGERADVQYLLKRPLVRLKYLAKTFKGINQIKPSVATEEMGEKYQDLIEQARQRANDERARLEDEAAASIDPTRARDPRSLAPLAGVTIDHTRSVRARDYFDIELIHSSGQQLTCKIETILRDDAPERGNSSDILFCEVSLAGRWLLFPPIPASYVSARPGDKDGEIIVMVRGMLAGGSEWRELMSLRSEDEGAVAEWLDMLSDSPAPPRLNRQSSFNTLRESYTMTGGLGDRPPPSEIDVPIGERADDKAQMWNGSEVNSIVGDLPAGPSLRRMKAKRYRSTPSSPITEDSYEDVHNRANRIAEQERYDERPSTSSRSRYHERPKSSYMPNKPSWTASSSASNSRKDYSVWLPSTDAGSDSESEDEDRDRAIHSKRPSMHRRTSSVPSMDMPTVHKLRKAPPETPRKVSDHRREPATPMHEPTSAPAKLQKRRPTTEKDDPKKSDPATPGTRPGSLGLRSSILPSFTPAFLKRHRRASSPLKHEYEPSTASESLSDSEYSDADDVESITSESTVEHDAISTIGELKDFNNLASLRPSSQPTPPRSTRSVGSGSVRPSDSASQGPYRHVPPPGVEPAKTVASIFSWSDRGAWDSLHPQECSIIVTPGLIEAFDLAQAGAAMSRLSGGEVASPSQRGVRPLVALELTPLVPLRRGTALDISIRSPPTPDSVIKMGNNVMFRSRTPEECEKLYYLINRARIDNPTYIALQNARGPIATSNWAEVMDKRNAARTNGSSSWLKMGSRRSSTYRSKGSRAASTAATDSSVGTMNTAFSALRRFSGSGNGKGIFNIAKSTLTSREGTRSTYSDSLSSGAATPIPIDPSMGTPVGITNAKIRLYIRETASKWRDMGSARLTVMLPPRPDPNVPANPKTTGMEKRILICGKSKGELMLDVTLGESCFERVARTGIAMSVWEEATGPNGEAIVGAVGGVSNARSKVYMVQMKSERDAAYTFGLVGKLRY